jgi:hypothetical protein
MNINTTATILGALGITTAFGVWCGSLQTNVANLQKQVDAKQDAGRGPQGPPGPAGQLAVIARGGGPQTEPIYQDTVTVSQPGIIFITARTFGGRHGVISNAGLRIETRLDGELVAANEEFEGESASITFHATATSATYIAPSRHRLEVKIVPQALTEKPTFSVDWFVVASQAEAKQ